MSAESEGCMAMFAGLVVGAIITSIVVGSFITEAWTLDVEDWRQESVRRGAAEWVMDPATGKTEWRWKEPKPNQDTP